MASPPPPGPSPSLSPALQKDTVQFNAAPAAPPTTAPGSLEASQPVHGVNSVAAAQAVTMDELEPPPGMDAYAIFRYRKPDGTMQTNEEIKARIRRGELDQLMDEHLAAVMNNIVPDLQRTYEAGTKAGLKFGSAAERGYVNTWEKNDIAMEESLPPSSPPSSPPSPNPAPSFSASSPPALSALKFSNSPASPAASGPSAASTATQTSPGAWAKAKEALSHPGETLDHAVHHPRETLGAISQAGTPILQGVVTGILVLPFIFKGGETAAKKLVPHRAQDIERFMNAIVKHQNGKYRAAFSWMKDSTESARRVGGWAALFKNEIKIDNALTVGQPSMFGGAVLKGVYGAMMAFIPKKHLQAIGERLLGPGAQDASKLAWKIDEIIDAFGGSLNFIGWVQEKRNRYGLDHRESDDNSDFANPAYPLGDYVAGAKQLPGTLRPSHIPGDPNDTSKVKGVSRTILGTNTVGAFLSAASGSMLVLNLPFVGGKVAGIARLTKFALAPLSMVSQFGGQMGGLAQAYEELKVYKRPFDAGLSGAGSILQALGGSIRNASQAGTLMYGVGLGLQNVGKTTDNWYIVRDQQRRKKAIEQDHQKMGVEAQHKPHGHPNAGPDVLASKYFRLPKWEGPHTLEYHERHQKPLDPNAKIVPELSPADKKRAEAYEEQDTLKDMVRANPGAKPPVFPVPPPVTPGLTPVANAPSPFAIFDRPPTTANAAPTLLRRQQEVFLPGVTPPMTITPPAEILTHPATGLPYACPPAVQPLYRPFYPTPMPPGLPPNGTSSN